MKILVTGHNGYAGAVLVELLLKNGYEVVGIDANYYNEDCTFYSFSNDITSIEKDIRDITKEDLKGVDGICHLAALSNDPVGTLNVQLTHEINYLASVRLARLAKEARVRKFIYASSCSLYGVMDGDDALTEKAEFAPVTAYAKSKVLTEKELLPMGDQNFCVTSLRHATAYGISPKLRVDIVVNNLVGWALTSGQIKILSDGTPWRPLVHVEDMARAYLAVIEAPRDMVNQEAFNVGTNEDNYQIKDIAMMVKEVLCECDVIIVGEHGSDSRSYKVNFDKIKQILPHFDPQWNLRKGIEQIYEFYEKYHMTKEKFEGRYFIRLKQLMYLIETNELSQENLLWCRSAAV